MKNKNIIFTIVLIGNLIIPLSLFAQIPSPLKNITILATIELDSNNLYKYSYKIFNPSTNNGQIYYIGIDISKPLQSQELSSTGLIIQVARNPKGILRNLSFDEEVKRMGSLLKKPVIPVASQIPPGWSSGIDAKGNIMWGSNKNNLIGPGQSLQGFVLMSFGLPGIRDVFVRPFFIDYDSLPEEYTENVEFTIQLENSLMFQTKTIGPTAPPADFKPVEFIDYIISMKHEASFLGWIKNKGFETSLDAKLSNAKERLREGDSDTARNILKALISEVEAQGCESYEKCSESKHLMPEAYALLKYNVQYLVERL